ncbi:MAG: hypothetical protein ACE5K3_10680, partial [bacterium]
MKQDVKTMTGEETVRYLEEKLRGKKVISVEVGDTILIKEFTGSFAEWAFPIWEKARDEGITEEEVNKIIQEVRKSA